MKIWKTLPLLLVVSACTLAAQSPADSLAALLPGMGEREKCEFINKHFYTFYSQDFGQAVVLVEEAKKLSQKNGWEGLQALSLKNLGVIKYLRGDYEHALEAYQNSLSIYEKTGNRSGEGFVLKELGNYFKKLKEYDTALSYLERGAVSCTAANDTLCLAEVLGIKGVVFLEMGKLEDAEAIFLQEKKLLEGRGNERSMSYVFDHLAEVAIGRGRFEQAIEYLQQSTAIRQKEGDLHGVAININNMGEAMLQAGFPDRAMPYFEDALQRSTSIGFNDLRRNAMQMLSETHAALGHPADAMVWLQKSYALKDSLFDVERSRQLAEMSTKYESEKKEKELVRQEAQLQRRNAFLLLSGVLLLAFSAIFFFILRQQKQKRKRAELQAELANAESNNRLQAERLRISRDLHDNLGAELTIIGSALNRRAFQTNSAEEKKELTAIGDNAKQAMGQLRETIWAIRHEQFSVKQLADKISDFAVRATHLPVEILVPKNEVFLSPSQTLSLYRIVQEAVTNAVKYAEASSIKIEFENAPENQLKLSISDNGKGFDSVESHLKVGDFGNGLANMRARAAELGGVIEFISQKNTSTTVEALIPLMK